MKCKYENCEEILEGNNLFCDKHMKDVLYEVFGEPEPETRNVEPTHPPFSDGGKQRLKEDWEDVIPDAFKESNNIEDHIAYTCQCGSVKFNLLKSGNIECAGCGRPAIGKWELHG